MAKIFSRLYIPIQLRKPCTLAGYSHIFSVTVIRKMCPKAEQVGLEKLHLVSGIQSNKIPVRPCWPPPCNPIPSTRVNTHSAFTSNFLVKGRPFCTSGPLFVKGICFMEPPVGGPWSTEWSRVCELSWGGCLSPRPSSAVLQRTNVATALPDFRPRGWACCCTRA